MKKPIHVSDRFVAAICPRPVGAALVCAVGLLVSSSWSADLIEVLPVTNKILMVTFDEGHIDYDVFGNEGANKPYYSALNTANAENKSNYSISSTDDPHYASAKNPVTIGRKAKGEQFNGVNNTPKYILQHHIYIELPDALVRGKTYTLTLTNLADNTGIYSFVYDEKRLRSPTIHVNQTGFVSDGSKYAYISQWMGSFNTATHANGALNLDGYSGAQFQVVRLTDNTVAHTGAISRQAVKTTQELTSGDFSTTPNTTKADVWECSFSAFTAPGTYKIAVDGIGCSYPFEIGADVYRSPFYSVMKAIFTQRQGVDKEIEGGQVYQRGHTNIMYVGTTTPVNVFGYYYDAGDWDGHNRHIGVPLDLMLLYDMRPGSFRDGDIANRYRLSSSSAWINEGSDGLPDILNEARWLLDFYKRARSALQGIGKGTGGVPGGRIPGAEGLIGPDAGCENRASWTDDRAAYINGEQTDNTYNYAAGAAYYAICLQKFYKVASNAEIDLWKNEALAAYSWADARSDDEAGEGSRDAKEIAAAALFRLTGTTNFQSDLSRLIGQDTKYPYYGCWQNPWPWQYAAMIYGLCPSNQPGLDAAFQKTIRTSIISKADNQITISEVRGMRMAFDKERMSGNGAFSTPRVQFSAFAHAVTGDAKYLKVIQDVTSYTLGGNQDSKCYVGQLGHNPDNNSFHPDSWRLLDYNSKVYKSTSLPGIVNYWGMKNCDFFGCGWSWTVDEDFSRSAAYPGIDTWPAGEWRMNNKYSIAGSEFTMNEILGQTAFAYGYLCGTAPAQAFTPNARPTVSLNLSANQDFRKEGCELSASVSGDTRIVKYYYDWHFIGESTNKSNGFAFFWIPPLADNAAIEITAVAYDDKGLISLPSTGGVRTVRIKAGAACSSDIVAVEQAASTRRTEPGVIVRDGQARVWLSSAGVYSLEIFDVRGTCILARRIVATAAGEQQIPLGRTLSRSACVMRIGSRSAPRLSAPVMVMR